jgi:hypothetical protein
LSFNQTTLVARAFQIPMTSAILFLKLYIFSLPLSFILPGTDNFNAAHKFFCHNNDIVSEQLVLQLQQNNNAKQMSDSIKKM